MRTLRGKSHRDQRGVVILWVALFLLVMLAFIGLGMDMAKLMSARVQLQKAADAAALAGASAFRDGEAATAVTLAKSRAYETAANNKAFEIGVTPVVLDTLNDVTVDLDSLWVTVTTRRDATAGTPVITHFLRVIGLPELGMRATAVAKAEGGCNLVPLAVQPPEDGLGFQIGCSHVYVIKLGPPNSTQGGYGPIDFGPCPGDPCPSGGAPRFLCQLANGYPCCVDSLGCVKSEQGNMTGPTRSGIEQRFAADTDQRPDICYSEYMGNGSRVITAPLTGPKFSCQTQQGYGGYLVHGLGTFFLRRIPGSGNQNFITAEYLGPLEHGLGTRDFHVRLIR